MKYASDMNSSAAKDGEAMLEKAKEDAETQAAKLREDSKAKESQAIDAVIKELFS